MILYHGKILPDSRQNELIAALGEDVCAPIAAGRALSRDAVVNACDALARQVLDGGFDGVVGPFLELFHISPGQFRDLIGLFTRESLLYKCGVELCDDERIID